MEAKNINIDEWLLSGGGAEGDSYVSKDDPAVLLKLYKDGFSKEDILKEISLSQAVYDNGVPCPKPGTFISSGSRFGVIFQKIKNKKSFCRAIADDPSCLVGMASRLASMGLELHSRKCNDPRIPDVTLFYRRLYSTAGWMDERTKSLMDKAFAIVEKSKTENLCHGDYHFGNVITDGEKDYFIDLGCFGYGNPDVDNSMMYCVGKMCPAALIEHNYHITLDQASEFWDEYKKFYYGEDAPSDEILETRYAPYLMLRMLYFIDVCGLSDPALVAMLQRVSDLVASL